MVKRLVFAGAGDLGREILAWMIHANPSLPSELDLCFIDDSIDCMSASGLALPTLGSIEAYIPSPEDEIVFSIANPRTRKHIVSTLISRSCNVASFVHPSVIRSLNAVIGTGCILLPYSILSENAQLGDYSIVNCHSSVGHDTRIGSYVTISSHVDITGHCVVEDEAFLASGSRILPGKRVGARAVVGAGAVASGSVPDGNTLYATPSKLLF
jgi:sugar O-acyltransferase (sialic acid O-acetyltransferase NeuD family)